MAADLTAEEVPLEVMGGGDGLEDLRMVDFTGEGMMGTGRFLWYLEGYLLDFSDFLGGIFAFPGCKGRRKRHDKQC